ncbi:MAG TPA: transporter [Paenibacillaceae bacterium]|nr:transporter [Paenibacillaceae bacterium]
MEQYADIKQGEKGAWVSIVAYVILSSLKLVIGYLFFSEALTADGLNNTTDIIASIAVLIGLKFSQKPPDKEHPYGHFRSETIAALFASFVMAVIGLEVLKGAFLTFFEPDKRAPDLMAGWVALGCALVMYFVYQYNFRLAKKIKNQALMAAAKDNLSDAFVSIGAFVGILGSQFHMPWLDPLAAFVVGIIIIKTAWEIFSEAALNLTDGFDDEEKMIHIKESISKVSGVKVVKDLKGRKHGNHIFLDVIIDVNPNLNVVESHNITEKIEKILAKEHRVKYAQIHIEPAETEKNIPHI